MVNNLIRQKEWILQLSFMNSKTLYLIKQQKHKMRRLQSKNHKIGTYKVSKISWSCLDDKRSVLDDVIHTLVYCHKGSQMIIEIFKDEHKEEEILTVKK